MWTTTSGNNDIQFGKGDHAQKNIYDLDLTPYGMDYQITGGTWAQTYDVLIDAIKQQVDRNNRYDAFGRRYADANRLHHAFILLHRSLYDR